MERIYKIKNRPSDTRIREILDEVPSVQIERVQRLLINKIKDVGLFKEYEYFKGWKLLLVDGVHHFSSQKVKCDKCQITNHSDGSITYSHSMLSAVIANPEMKEVLPLCQEPIRHQDGTTKNDCELNAAKRIIEKVQTRHLKEKFIFVEDALFANGPHIKKILEKENRFIIRVKPGSGAGSVFKQYLNLINPGTDLDPKPKGLQRKDQKSEEGIKRPDKEVVIRHQKEEDEKFIYRWSFVNGFRLNDSHPEIIVNYLHFEEENKKTKKVKKFDWITNIELTKKCVSKVSTAGRARWMIENQTFNTLKNHGYHFEHNFGHGHDNLCTNFALLMMIAFLIDQIQQLSNQLFKTALIKAKRKKYLWDKMRALFLTLPFNSMEMIYKTIIHGEMKLDYLCLTEDTS